MESLYDPGPPPTKHQLKMDTAITTIMFVTDNLSFASCHRTLNKYFQFSQLETSLAEQEIPTIESIRRVPKFIQLLNERISVGQLDCHLIPSL